MKQRSGEPQAGEGTGKGRCTPSINDKARFALGTHEPEEPKIKCSHRAERGIESVVRWCRGASWQRGGSSPLGAVQAPVLCSGT